MRRSPSTASWSRSSPRARRSRSSSKARGRSPSSARRWAQRTRPTPGLGRSAATSRSRCPTTSCTAPTRPSPPSARSPSGSVAEPDYVAVNRDSWTQANAEYTDRQAHDAWAQEQITYGKWSIPESELRVLPNVSGKEVLELGCGTAYFGAWLKRAGAKRVVGVDVTPAQLDTARRMNEEHGLGLDFVEANAEETGLPGESFDLAVSEYGASIWCDPAKWIPEAARLLRPGGELFFLRGSTLQLLCMPDDVDGKVDERLR